MSGFTLIELMTAVSIFLIVVMISMSAIFGVFDANRKSRSLKNVMSNLNLAVEGMSKEMRFGTKYHCGVSGVSTAPQNCPGGDNYITFLSTNNEQITYRLNGTAIEKDVNGAGFVPLTAPEVVIEDLKFYVLGAGGSEVNFLQPKVEMHVKSRAGSGRSETKFALQTLVSQRMLDGENVNLYSTPYVTPYVTPYITPASYYDLVVTKSGTGSGTVSGPGISCGSTCAANFIQGSSVSLTPSPDANTAFSGWSGACSGTGTCDLIMNAHKSVTALFNLASYDIEYLIVAGGGGGGRGALEPGGTVLAPQAGGGGGAGGVLSGSVSVISGSSMSITVGSGGGEGVNGTNSSISGIGTAVGGGHGGSPWNYNPTDGGSGGGGQANWLYGAGIAGQGHDGGQYAGGGGGAGAPGGSNNGPGGSGVPSSITGSSRYYGGGGGAGTTGGTAGGAGGGGNGADSYFGNPATAGAPNTGGGGGGGTNNVVGEFRGAPGGSGIVIIRYAGAQRGTGGSVTSVGGYTIHTFTSAGTFTP